MRSVGIVGLGSYVPEKVLTNFDLEKIVETRQSGIFVSQRARNIKSISEEIAQIRGGEVIVVDIAKLTDEEQTLVFGDILRTIYALYAEEGSEREDLP